MTISRLDYCQYLLVSQTNYTITNFADHAQKISHDQINRYLSKDKLTPRLVWELVKTDVVPSTNGYLLFDDTIIDKNFSHDIEGVRRQYSGNAHGIVKGIGVINCVYLNPELDQYWIIDYRIFDPDNDGRTKLDHISDMIKNVLHNKQLSFRTVLMDSWYATRDIIMMIEEMGKIYYCPLKINRLVDDGSRSEMVPEPLSVNRNANNNPKTKYQPIEKLLWSDYELNNGKIIKIKNFPPKHKVQLFRVAVATNRTDHIITNDVACSSPSDAREVCAKRWKIEQFHRELKQTTGVEKCQCRKARIQKNHIACAMLVWVRLKQIAYQTGQTVYQIKHGLLDDYLIEQLRNPRFRMVDA
jgi:hypothetical protein